MLLCAKSLLQMLNMVQPDTGSRPDVGRPNQKVRNNPNGIRRRRLLMPADAKPPARKRRGCFRCNQLV